MRYKLQRNANGMITQCENADGGNIYAQREEINKKALKNLERTTPGKLGNLSNLQIFNFKIKNIQSGSDTTIYKEYNTTNTFPANATQTIMFGVSGLNSKAQYYNILDVKAQFRSSTNVNYRVDEDSFIEFYILQNIETSTTSLGTKITQPAPLFGSGGGAVSFDTSGNEEGNQYFSVNIGDDAVNVPSNTKGLRASGLALKTINIQFPVSEVLDNFELNVSVFVDVTSVSQTY